MAVGGATRLPPPRSDDSTAAGPPLLICHTSVRLVYSRPPHLEIVHLSATWEPVGSRQLGPNKDGYHRGGVALAIHRKLMPTCVSWTLVDERILSARFRHTAGHLATSLLLWHILPLNVLTGKQRKSSTRVWKVSSGRVAREI